MNTLAEILSNSYSDQGIQNLEVFYDSYLFNLKIKESTGYYNILLIEKFQFDYDNEKITRIKSPLTLNFGDTGTSNPFYSNGNTFIKAILDGKTKNVYLVGLRTMQNGNTIPVVYIYDLNIHELKNIFPKQSDITNFNNFNNFSFKTDNLPIANIVDSDLHIVFQTEDGSYNYINALQFRLKSEECELKKYDMVKYDISKNVQFTDVNNSFLTYKIDDYHGVLKRTSFV